MRELVAEAFDDAPEAKAGQYKNPNLALLAAGSGIERDREVYRTVRKMMHADSLPDWEPNPVPGIPHELIGCRDRIVEHLAALRTGKGTDDVPATKQAVRWAGWQSHVTSMEEENHGRLSALLWAARELGRVANRNPTKPAVAGLLRDVLNLLASKWRVLPDAVPDTAFAARDLADRVCRDYRAMPREWREL